MRGWRGNRPRLTWAWIVAGLLAFGHPAVAQDGPTPLLTLDQDTGLATVIEPVPLAPPAVASTVTLLVPRAVCSVEVFSTDESADPVNPPMPSSSASSVQPLQSACIDAPQ